MKAVVNRRKEVIVKKPLNYAVAEVMDLASRASIA